MASGSKSTTVRPLHAQSNADKHTRQRTPVDYRVLSGKELAAEHKSPTTRTQQSQQSQPEGAKPTATTDVPPSASSADGEVVSAGGGGGGGRRPSRARKSVAVRPTAAGLVGELTWASVDFALSALMTEYNLPPATRLRPAGLSSSSSSSPPSVSGGRRAQRRNATAAPASLAGRPLSRRRLSDESSSIASSDKTNDDDVDKTRHTETPDSETLTTTSAPAEKCQSPCVEQSTDIALGMTIATSDAEMPVLANQQHDTKAESAVPVQSHVTSRPVVCNDEKTPIKTDKLKAGDASIDQENTVTTSGVLTENSMSNVSQSHSPELDIASKANTQNDSSLTEECHEGLLASNILHETAVVGDLTPSHLHDNSAPIPPSPVLPPSPTSTVTAVTSIANSKPSPLSPLTAAPAAAANTCDNARDVDATLSSAPAASISSNQTTVSNEVAPTTTAVSREPDTMEKELSKQDTDDPPELTASTLAGDDEKTAAAGEHHRTAFTGGKHVARPSESPPLELLLIAEAPKMAVLDDSDVPEPHRPTTTVSCCEHTPPQTETNRCRRPSAERSTKSADCQPPADIKDGAGSADSGLSADDLVSAAQRCIDNDLRAVEPNSVKASRIVLWVMYCPSWTDVPTFLQSLYNLQSTVDATTAAASQRQGTSNWRTLTEAAALVENGLPALPAPLARRPSMHSPQHHHQQHLTPTSSYQPKLGHVEVSVVGSPELFGCATSGGGGGSTASAAGAQTPVASSSRRPSFVSTTVLPPPEVLTIDSDDERLIERCEVSTTVSSTAPHLPPQLSAVVIRRNSSAASLQHTGGGGHTAATSSPAVPTQMNGSPPTYGNVAAPPTNSLCLPTHDGPPQKRISSASPNHHQRLTPSSPTVARSELGPRHDDRRLSLVQRRSPMAADGDSDNGKRRNTFTGNASGIPPKKRFAMCSSEVGTHHGKLIGQIKQEPGVTHWQPIVNGKAASDSAIAKSTQVLEKVIGSNAAAMLMRPRSSDDAVLASRQKLADTQSLLKDGGRSVEPPVVSAQPYHYPHQTLPRLQTNLPPLTAAPFTRPAEAVNVIRLPNANQAITQPVAQYKNPWQTTSKVAQHPFLATKAQLPTTLQQPAAVTSRHSPMASMVANAVPAMYAQNHTDVATLRASRLNDRPAAPIREQQLTTQSDADQLRRVQEIKALPQGDEFQAAISKWDWVNLDGLRMPAVYRGHDKFVAVHIVQMRLLSKFPPNIPGDMMRRFTMVSHKMTLIECWTFNTVNALMCKFEFGCQLFTTHDEVVKLADVERFYWSVKSLNLNRMVETYQAEIRSIGNVHMSLTAKVSQLQASVEGDYREVQKILNVQTRQPTGTPVVSSSNQAATAIEHSSRYALAGVSHLQLAAQQQQRHQQAVAQAAQQAAVAQQAAAVHQAAAAQQASAMAQTFGQSSAYTNAAVAAAAAAAASRQRESVAAGVTAAGGLMLSSQQQQQQHQQQQAALYQQQAAALEHRQQQQRAAAAFHYQQQNGGGAAVVPGGGGGPAVSQHYLAPGITSGIATHHHQQQHQMGFPLHAGGLIHSPSHHHQQVAAAAAAAAAAAVHHASPGHHVYR